MAPKMKFAEGEKVLCFHGPLIYEAKCLKSSVTKDKHVKYFIHYAGWNKNWDEWVPESRVLKYNDANVQKQKEVQQAHSAQPTKTKKASKSRKSEAAADETRSSTPAAKETELTPARGGRNANKESHNDSGSEHAKKKLRGRLDLTAEKEKLQASINITLPDELKQLLTDDWYAITKQQKLLSLPAKNTINKIFESYIQKKNLTSLENKTVIDGIKDHFNAIINRQLLYDFEKLHHKTIISQNPELSFCDIYGLVHLLRLFTKFGGMLSYLDMEDKALQYTLNMIKEFLDYLVKNRSTLVTSDDYISSTPEYQKKAFN